MGARQGVSRGKSTLYPPSALIMQVSSEHRECIVSAVVKRFGKVAFPPVILRLIVPRVNCRRMEVAQLKQVGHCYSWWVCAGVGSLGNATLWKVHFVYFVFSILVYEDFEFWFTDRFVQKHAKITILLSNVPSAWSDINVKVITTRNRQGGVTNEKGGKITEKEGKMIKKDKWSVER